MATLPTPTLLSIPLSSIAPGVAIGDVLRWNGAAWISTNPGYVNGPVSSTDNAVVRFDLATGKLIQNSTVTLSDGGVFSDLTSAANLTTGSSGELRLFNPAGTFSTRLKSAAVVANRTWTLPLVDGAAGTLLQTDGAGNTSWSAIAAGDLTGPASSTDNAVARFDLATGKLIQNSTVTLSDGGAFSDLTSAANLTTGTAGELRLFNPAGTFSTRLKSAAVAANRTWTLPLVDGAAGALLQTDGAGTTIWAPAGDVIGPAGSTDNAIVRFDLATGKLIQNSTITLSDAGVFSDLTSAAAVSATTSYAIGGTPILRTPVVSTNLALGASTLGALTIGANDVVVGLSAGAAITSGSGNTIIGVSAGTTLATGSNNVCIGINSTMAAGTRFAISIGNASFSNGDDCIVIGRGNGNVADAVTAIGNIIIGTTCGTAIKTAACNNNIIMGTTTGTGLTSGSNNILMGVSSANDVVSGSNNIIMGTTGSLGAAISNVVCLGPSSRCTSNGGVAIGISATSQATNGIAIGNGATCRFGANVVIGVSANTSFSGFNTNSVSIGTSCSANIDSGSTGAVTIGHSSSTFGIGTVCTGASSFAYGQYSITIGASSGNPSDSFSANNNITIGRLAGTGIKTAAGIDNIFIGRSAGAAVTSGATNILIGLTAGNTITTGSNNVAIGNGAVIGAALSDAIAIGRGATPAVSNRLTIGTAANITSAFIHGIRGVTTTVNDAVAVLIDSAGQLGTVSSSKRYKEDIQVMNDFSNRIYDSQPVMFKWKPEHNQSRKQQFGLIAEQIANVFPELAILNNNGDPETVAYHLLPVILLNEIIKLKKELIDLSNL